MIVLKFFVLYLTDQLTGDVENHRIKGLGVGKCYEYYPPPSAPDYLRVPAPVTPATTPGNSRLGNYHSFSPSQMYPCQDIPSLKNPQDRYSRNFPTENHGYMSHSRQWQNVKGSADDKTFSRKMPKHFGYLQSPLRFGQSHPEKVQENHQEDARSVHKGQGHTSQGSIQADDMYGYNK